MEPLTGPRDLDRARREIVEAGYAGERVVLIVPTDFPTFRALADVGADMMEKIGLKVDYQALDWATVSYPAHKLLTHSCEVALGLL